MKTGDLVELSAYGKKLKILESFQNKIGLVLDYHFGSVYVLFSGFKPTHMNRRDIKKLGK